MNQQQYTGAWIKRHKMMVATGIALLFHGCGVVGIATDTYRSFFVNATPLNLLLMFGLLLWTQPDRNRFFWLFILIAASTGIIVELIGVNTGWLFGNYTYGTVLGFKWMGVPLLIGANWFVMMYCSGITMHTILRRTLSQVAQETQTSPGVLKAVSVIIDGAVLAVFFDWVMEPVAIKLGYWQWGGDGSIPVYNYICWMGASALLLTVFHYSPFVKSNKFAVHLLLIQLLFFLILRTVL